MIIIGKVYNFRTVAPLTLGDTYRGMKCIQSSLGISLTDKEKVLLQNIATKVSNETNNYRVNIEKEIVYKFKDINGNEELLLKNWIVETSLESVELSNLTLNLTGLLTDEIDNLINLITDNGYKINSKTIVEL